ncbi:hypothetical protein TV39_08990 [Arthrobacter sp. SPG23]|uniref:hypothetical protein n=1 Tax=Arthrobacter sp. SPG23 TaxID=1610703 RepID=UPI0005BD75D0|nr:hypothetical protein [Arthrobacter sp. SPG23]KIS27852.1 hypothetical protein TV39_08990 [Arthrobacter sp. SPG23]
MGDKIFLATVMTESSLTTEQLGALAEHGWEPVPNPSEDHPASLLFRQAQSDEGEAVGQFADLIKDVRLSGIRGLVWTPFENSRGYAYITRPEEAGAFFKDLFEASQAPGKPGDPPKPDDAAEKRAQEDEKPKKAAALHAETFPAIPEYVWKSLKPDTKDELAKKLVEYTINRPDAAAYASSFEDAALFVHTEAGERANLAKKILEQKHGMTAQHVRGETLVNDSQEQRVELMKKAVAAAGEINEHLIKWRDLSGSVLPLLIATTIAAGVFVLASLGLVFVGRISGWEMAVLAFVFALMAVSPATLLLIGRPLKGLDEWSPNKQAEKAEEASKEEPAKDKGKSEEKADK